MKMGVTNLKLIQLMIFLHIWSIDEFTYRHTLLRTPEFSHPQEIY